MENILEVKNISVVFKIGGSLFTKPQKLKAVQNISFNLEKGKTLGIVGESGCGKSTLGRAILKLQKINSGEIIFDGMKTSNLSKIELLEFRRNIQIIFQDPLASLNPRMTVGQIIAEPLKSFSKELTKKQRIGKVLEIMKEVGLLPEMLNRYPHEFSGGQAQRIGIARALISKPKLIVCDEPVSALDVSIQAQIINLLKSLQKKHNISLIFISHDLSVVNHISDKIAVLYLGKIIEFAKKNDFYKKPKHPYSKALLSAAPIPAPRIAKKRKYKPLKGELPSPINPPSGCAFRTRCELADSNCAIPSDKFELEDSGNNHLVACPKIISNN